MRFALGLCACFSTTAFADPDPAPVDPPGDAKPAHPKPDGKSLNKIDTTKIEALFDKGTKHYDLGEWDAAIATFKQAYALMPDPSFLFNLGQAYRQKGSCREATATYRSYLRNATDDDRAKVEQFLHDLVPCVKAEEQREEQRRADEQRARVLLMAPSPGTWPRTVRRVGLVTAIAGGASLAAGIYFAIRASSLENEFEQRCATDCASDDAIRSLDRRGRAASRNATILLVVGGSTAIVGSGLWLFGRRHESVAVTPTVGGAVVTAGRTF